MPIRDLLPREHGAYGQLAFPIVTSLAAAGVSGSAAMIAAAAVAGFLAHEPAAIVLGLRGARARNDLRPAATRWLAVCLSTAAFMGAWPAPSIAAVAPGLALAAGIAARPPAPSRLRTLGWALVAASIATAVMSIAAFRL